MFLSIQLIGVNRRNLLFFLDSLFFGIFGKGIVRNEFDPFVDTFFFNSFSFSKLLLGL